MALVAWFSARAEKSGTYSLLAVDEIPSKVHARNCVGGEVIQAYGYSDPAEQYLNVSLKNRDNEGILK